MRLWIDVSHIYFQRPIKITPLLWPDYYTFILIRWGTLNFPLILIILLVINEVHHLRLYHLRIHHFIRIQLRYRFQSHFIFGGTVLLLCQPLPWHICVDDTRNVSENRDVILLLPYSQTKNNQLTPLQSLSLLQWTQLWVVRKNSGWKIGKIFGE